MLCEKSKFSLSQKAKITAFKTELKTKYKDKYDPCFLLREKFGHLDVFQAYEKDFGLFEEPSTFDQGL